MQDGYSCSSEYLKKININKFQGFGFANNHCLDYGLEGASETIGVIRKAGIEVFGFSNDLNYSIGKFESRGIRVGIIACVKSGRWSKELYGYGPDSYNPDRIINLIKTHRGDFDHLVIYPHWGTELIIVPDHRDTECAKMFIDAGATAVIGHHPHVSQGVERYKHGFIAYSLGSFIYIHEDELGYSGINTDRLISMCVNVEFGSSDITAVTCHYYRYNENKKIPENATESEPIRAYAEILNSGIYDQKLRRRQIRKVLFHREIISFWERFKSSPFKATGNYSRFLCQTISKWLFNKQARTDGRFPV